MMKNGSQKRPKAQGIKKDTHNFACKCLIIFALPQGLEPWTL